MPENYRVGYRRPPKKTQFKKGQSGNPRGRPKGSHNLATDLKEELEDRVTVRESGRSRRLSKQQVLIKTLMAKALQGDLKAAAAILNMVLRLDLGAQEAAPVISADDELVLSRFGDQVLAQLKRKLEKKGDKS
jgi:Family of unknown function (DUF5681)